MSMPLVKLLMLLVVMDCLVMAVMPQQPSDMVLVQLRSALVLSEMLFQHHSVDHYVLKMKAHLMEYYLSDALSDVCKRL